MTSTPLVDGASAVAIREFEEAPEEIKSQYPKDMFEVKHADKVALFLQVTMNTRSFLASNRNNRIQCLLYTKSETCLLITILHN